MIGGSDISRRAAPIRRCSRSTDPITNPPTSAECADDNLDFSPRIGFAYDLTGRGQARAARRFRTLLRQCVPEHSVVHGAAGEPDRLPDRIEPVGAREIPCLAAGHSDRSPSRRRTVQLRCMLARSVQRRCDGSVGRLMTRTSATRSPKNSTSAIQLGHQHQLRIRSGIYPCSRSAREQNHQHRPESRNALSYGPWNGAPSPVRARLGMQHELRQCAT